MSFKVLYYKTARTVRSRRFQNGLASQRAVKKFFFYLGRMLWIVLIFARNIKIGQVNNGVMSFSLMRHHLVCLGLLGKDWSEGEKMNVFLSPVSPQWLNIQLLFMYGNVFLLKVLGHFHFCQKTPQ